MIQKGGAMAFETPNSDSGDLDLAVNDLGPLAWVLDELRKSLDAATKAIKRFVRDADAARGSDLATIDTSALRIARQQVHSSVGALDMVGLAGPAAVLRAMELTVQKFVQQPEKCNEESALKVERASFALVQFLDATVAGKSLSAVALFPQFKPVQELLGAERIHPADLWAFDFNENQPKFELQAGAMTPSVTLRAELDKCVLQIVKSNDVQAALTLRDRFASLHAGGDESVKTLWAVTAAFFEALGHGLITADLYVKRMPSRILGQYNLISKGELGSMDVMLRDLLFFCAQAAPKNIVDTPVLSAVRAGYRLSRYRYVDYVVGQFGSFDPAVLAQARKRVSGAKDLWSALAGGDTSKSKATADQFSLVADSLVKLHAPSQTLADALMRAVEPSTSSAKTPSAELAMEVATAVLYLEAAFEDLDPNDPELVSRTQRLAHRLESVRSGGGNEPLEPWIEELYRRVSDRQTMGSVVGELRVSLSELERSLDQFFRDPAQKQVLQPVPGQLAQMRGVLTVLGLSDAAQAVIRMRSVIEELLVTEIDPRQAREAGTFDKLGNNLGALGFLIDMLGYQPSFAKKLFSYDAATGELRPLMGRSEPRVMAGDSMSFGPDIVVKVAAPSASPAGGVVSAGSAGGGQVLIAPAMLAASAALASQAGKLNQMVASSSAPPAQVASSPPSDDFGDDDIRDIFLEEAREVVQTGGEALDALDADPSNLADQTTLRRAFHTLKGSSRMVGLNEFGEAGWSMEQVFNAWLAEQKPVSSDLMKLSRNAMAHFGQWVEAIASNDDVGFAASTVRASADAMRLNNQLLAIPPVVRAISVAPVATAAAAAVVAAVVPSAVSAAPPADPDSLDWMFEADPQVEPVDQTAYEPTLALRVETPAEPLMTKPVLSEPTVSFDLGAQMPVSLSHLAPHATGAAFAPLVAAPNAVAVVANSISTDVSTTAPGFSDLDLADFELAEFELPVSEPVAAPAAVEHADEAAAAIDFSSADEFGGAADFTASEIASLGDFELPAADELPKNLSAELDFDFDSPSEKASLHGADYAATSFGEPTLDIKEAEAFDDAMLEEFVLDFAPAVEPVAAAVPLAAVPLAAVPLAAMPLAAMPLAVMASDPIVIAAPAVVELDLIQAATAESDAAEIDLSSFVLADEPAIDAAPEFVAQVVVSSQAAGVESGDLAVAGAVAALGAAIALATPSSVEAASAASADDFELDLEDFLLDRDTPPVIAAQPALPALTPPMPTPPTIAHVAPVVQSADSAAAFAESIDDQIKVIGPLRIGIPLYNVYLNEADEWSRKLLDEASVWQIDTEASISDSMVTWAHSLGGSSATVGFVALSDVARALESALQRGQRAGVEEVHSYSILFVDAANEIRRLLHQFAAGFLKEPRTDLIERLRSFEPTTELAAATSSAALDGEADSKFSDSAMSALEAFELADEQAVTDVAPNAVADLPIEAQEEVVAQTAIEGESEDLGELSLNERVSDVVTDATPEPQQFNWTAHADPRANASRVDLPEVSDPREVAPTPEPAPAPAPAPAPVSVVDMGVLSAAAGAAVLGSVALVGASLEGSKAAPKAIDSGAMPEVTTPVVQMAKDEVPVSASPPPQPSPMATVAAAALAAPVAFIAPLSQVVVSAAAVQDIDDDIDVLDAVDADLFPIFEEEALELMPTLSGALRQWQARNDNMSAKNEVLRALHTLKGSARLAGALRVGEMSHRMESDIERFHSPTSADIEPLLGQFDAMQLALDALRHRDQSAYVEAAPQVAADSSSVMVAAALAGVELAQGASPAPVAAIARATTLPAPMRTNAAMQTVRVRSQLLDRMLNQTGEVMITRSRLEAELSQLRGSLGDLTNNLERMRQQLREIEVQAETQMQSRQQLAKTADVSFDPLEFDRFTRFQEITRSMAESVNDVATVQRNIMRAVESTEDDLIAQARQTRELQRDLLKTRMVEFEGISERLYRVVRQAGKDTGKQVKLDIIGGSIELDRGVLDRMTPAFEHLLRNCVAHGIESAQERAAANKEGSGEIIITLHQEGNEVAVEFADDGAGLNIAKIRAKAIAQNLIAHDASVSESEAAALIFMPGFTTADSVSELAGRGIGMDVVRSEVQALGGRVETKTQSGRGTSFKMVLPLTTAVTQVVMLRAGKLSIGVPSNVVEIVRRATAKELELAYNSGVYEFGGEQVPFFWSGALLQSSARSTEHMGRSTPVVVFRSAQQRVAMHVDEVLGNQEVVVKNLGAQLSRLPGLAGMSVLASGAVVLIYNPVALASVYGTIARSLSADKAQPEVLEVLDQPVEVVAMDASDEAGQSGHGFSVPKPTRPKAEIPLVMVVDDSITVRRVTQRLLAREGYRVVLAADGLQALEKLQDEIPAVVLSDIEMPRMDGFDLARNIRMDNDFFNIPIIMITSRIAEKHKEHAKELGVNHYLGKPYAEDELLSLVRRYCFDEQPA